jgi:ankyrin repeat protein
MPYLNNSINNIRTIRSVSTLNHFFNKACNEQLKLLKISKRLVNLFESNALHFAASHHNSSVIEILMNSMPAAQERLHGFDNNDESVLVAAITTNNKEVFNYLLAIDELDINNGTTNTSLLYCIVNSVAEGALSETIAIYFIRQLLTDERIDVNQTCWCCDNSILHKALCSNRSHEFIKAFLDHPRIDLNITNSNGSTVLHTAATCNSDVNNTKHILALMKRTNININARDDFGITAYGRACLHGTGPIADLLKSHGGTQLAGFYVHDSGFIGFENVDDNAHPRAIEFILTQHHMEQDTDDDTDDASNSESDDSFGSDYEDDY